MAAVPQLGRAAGVEPQIAPEAAATQQLYERYARQIYGFCLHQLGNREEAEDATQTTFLNAFRGLRRGISPEAESAWLFKIAHNVCLTRRRSSWRRGRVETPGDMQALQDFVAAPQRMGTDELVELQEALAGMPANQRKAILLREWRGMSYREIAEEMELSQAAIETLIFRARRSLAKGLEEPEQRGVWKRLRQGMDIGSALAVLKTLFAGGAAVKAVATATAVTSVGLVTAVPGGERVVRRATVERPAATTKAPATAGVERRAAPTPPIATGSERLGVASVGQVAKRALRVPVPNAKAWAKAKGPAVALGEALDSPPPVVQPAAPPQAEQAPPAAPAPQSDEPERSRPAGDRSKAEEKRGDSRRDESPKAEAPKVESNRGESPKAETPKVESKSGESPKAETPRNGGPKSEAPKTEIRKLEAPKGAAPRVESPKGDAPAGEGTRAAPPAAPQAADGRSAEKSEGLRSEPLRLISGPSPGSDKGEGKAETKAEEKVETKGESKAEARGENKGESKGEGNGDGRGKKP